MIQIAPNKLKQFGSGYGQVVRFGSGVGYSAASHDASTHSRLKYSPAPFYPFLPPRFFFLLVGEHSSVRALDSSWPRRVGAFLEKLRDGLVLSTLAYIYHVIFRVLKTSAGADPYESESLSDDGW